MKLSKINKQQLLDRFLQYVCVGTAANPTSDDYPSSLGQLQLGKILVNQLLEMGIADAHQGEHGLVWGADSVVKLFPGLVVDVETCVQYRNMADALRKFPKAIELAERSYCDLGFPARRDSIRGGTDGALMSEMGLPTPNLSVGQYNIHSVREFASLDYMVQAAQHVVRLMELWSNE